MFASVAIDESIDQETILYRIVDFFTAARLASLGHFFFTRADQFSDTNEALMVLLSDAYGFAKFASENNERYRTQNGLHPRHQRFKQGHYVSCWSKNPDSVAMWSLYSQDLCGVRIAMKVSHLACVLDRFANLFRLDRITESDIGSDVLIATEAIISPVTYLSLDELSRRATRRLEAFRRLESSKNSRKPFILRERKSLIGTGRKDSLRSLIRDRSKYLTVKDYSYRHEEEVRLILRIGENKITKEFVDLCCGRECHSEDVFTRLRLKYWIDNLVPNPYEFVTVDDIVLDSVSIDPRCPIHKLEFITNYFSSLGIKITKSKCFNYLGRF